MDDSTNKTLALRKFMRDIWHVPRRCRRSPISDGFFFFEGKISGRVIIIVFVFWIRGGASPMVRVDCMFG